MLPALRSQFGELDRMRREMDRLWESITRDHFPSTFDYDWVPSLDLSDRGDSLVAKLEVPGTDPKDINISVTGDVLTISGEKKREIEEKEHNYHLVERSYGKFSRSIRLPSSVNPDRVEASYKDGILSISLDKTAQAKTNKIEVKAA
ncbi:MAG: Hsp20/alpha crystallin family protein [Syntrophobacterales bacterium]|jgi:HSP20 family protein